jgi:hypothetical protein
VKSHQNVKKNKKGKVYHNIPFSWGEIRQISGKKH